jgi:hypothetical protein
LSRLIKKIAYHNTSPIVALQDWFKRLCITHYAAEC